LTDSHELNESWPDVDGCDVRVLFDANLATSQRVKDALDRLVRALRKRGARVTVCHLSAEDVGPKGGPDDLLAKPGGVDALYRVLRGGVGAAEGAPSKSPPVPARDHVQRGQRG
jgi:Domain of unknown function (DUF3854)